MVLGVDNSIFGYKISKFQKSYKGIGVPNVEEWLQEQHKRIYIDKEYLLRGWIILQFIGYSNDKRATTFDLLWTQ